MHTQQSSGAHLVTPPLSPAATTVKSPSVPNEEKFSRPEQSCNHLPPVNQTIKSSLRSVVAGPRQKKSVHWTANCKDNQNNTPPRPRSRSADRSTMRPHSLMESFLGMPQDTRSLAATARLEEKPSRSRNTGQKVPSKRQKVESLVKDKHTTSKTAVHHLNAESCRAAPKTTRSTRETHHAGKGSKTDARHSLSKTLVWRSEIPPYVPDPPSRREPPPAPRPARLPTPDLPEIDHSPFCACNTAYCNEQYKSSMTPSELKMIQQSMTTSLNVDCIMLTPIVEAATAYIKSAR